MKRHLLLLTLTALFATPSPAQTIESVLLNEPTHFDGLHFAPDGHLYFGGSWAGSDVYRSKPGGELELFATGFEGPTDLAMDSKGNLFVTNYNANYVSRIEPDGTVERFATTPLGPAGITVDTDDNLYVTVYGTPNGEGRSVLRIDPTGQVETWAEGPQLHASVGIAVDPDGVVYVLNGWGAQIFRIPSKGVIELHASLPLVRGDGGGGHLDWAAGQLFAASNIGAAYRIAPNGAVHTVVRASRSVGASDPLLSPLVTGANGLTATPDGRSLFVGATQDGLRTLVEISDPIPPPLPRDGWRAYHSQRFAEAESIFEELASAPTVDPGVWYGLGLLKHGEQDWDAAASHYTRAAEAPQLRVLAHYNLARAEARAGRIERAVAALRTAVESGFADPAALESEADLSSIRSHAEWAAIVGQATDNEDARASSTAGKPKAPSAE